MKIIYRHDRDSPELDAADRMPGWQSGLRITLPTSALFAWATWQIDSARGGYVREVDANGKALREHPRREKR